MEKNKRTTRLVQTGFKMAVRSTLHDCFEVKNPRPVLVFTGGLRIIIIEFGETFMITLESRCTPGSGRRCS